ncbi:MAG: DUF2155 domain-containing protein [Arenibacterium sp.]
MIRTLALLVALSTPVTAQETTQAEGVLLRGLDKVSGKSTDIEIAAGRSARFGRLTILASECRYPAGNPSGDAYAGLTISEDGSDGPIFRGWMISSAPALSALDHQRYDVWVIRCTTSEG